jgi:2-oxoglutarate ferredoxin oxidoreductase subunit gamma
VPANTLAHEMGNDRALNMVMLGAVNTITGIVTSDALLNAVAAILEGKKAKLIEVNQKALSIGSESVAA